MIAALAASFGFSAMAESPGATPDAAERAALTHFSEGEIADGRARSRQHLWTAVAATIASMILLTALAHPAAAGAMERAISARLGARAFAAAALMVAAVFAAYYLVRLPFAFVSGHLIEHAWGLSRQTAGAFFFRWAKMAAIGALAGTVAVVAVLELRARLPAAWPAAAWGAVSALVLLYIYIMPVLIDPLFGRFTPVNEPEVLERVRSVTERAGLDVGSVLWLDASARTSRTNAYFTGLGGTKRIVLWDTLNDRRTEDGRIDPAALDSVEVILAHEAGHWKHGHMWKGTLLALLGLGVFFALLALLDRSGWSWMPARELPHAARGTAVALLLAGVFGFLANPVSNSISRSFERQADMAALEYTRNPEAFIRSQVELSRRNVSNLTPNRMLVFWFYTHPPTLQRIAMAEAFAAEGASCD